MAPLIHLLVAMCVALVAAPSRADGVRIATWNLGWLMSRSTHARWVEECARFDWPIAPAAGSEAALALAGLPYCDVHNGMVFPPELCGERAAQATIPRARFPAAHPCRVSADLARWSDYQRKLAQIARMFARLHEAGVTHVVMQEVFDTAALAPVLPPGWQALGTRELDGDAAVPIAQHLAVAWRPGAEAPDDPFVYRALADAGGIERPLRPGLQFRLTVQDRTVWFLAVHLKAGCRSRRIDAPLRPYDREPATRARILLACATLRRQIPALEAWIDARAAAGQDFVVLGDFNRALGTEDRDAPARLDGSSAGSPNDGCRRALHREGHESVRCNGRIGRLLPELNDAQPPLAIVWRADFLGADGVRLQMNRGAYPQGSIGHCGLWSRTRFRRDDEPGPARPVALAHDGIAHVLISDALRRRLGLDRLALHRLDYDGAVVSADGVPPDEALPSDHCPHFVDLGR